MKLRSPQRSCYPFPRVMQWIIRDLPLNASGDAYYLSRIATDVAVYTLRKPKAATGVAKDKQYNGTSSAGK